MNRTWNDLWDELDRSKSLWLPALGLPEFDLGRLQTAMRMLTERERFVIGLIYGSGMTLTEAGGLLSNHQTKKRGVSPERVRQIVEKTKRKLRHPTRSKYLKFDNAEQLVYND